MRLKQQKQHGRQPVRRTQRYRRRRCRAESDVPLCADDDWVSKCPSGCRLQGLISQMERDVERKLLKVCETAKSYEDAAETSMTAVTRIYNSNRRVIVTRYISELKFAEGAEELSRTLTSLRKRSSSLSQRLKELRGAVRKQVEDLYRTEVEIDMTLRTCHGSCRSALPFTVDHASYQTLETDMEQLNKAVHQRHKAVTPPEDTAHVWINTVDMSPAPSAEYRRIPAVQRELLTQFEDIGQNELGLEELLDFEDVEVLEHF
ncbi:fibrinogen alpha chain [Limanda limanda]|uniref:fibrinogen alpha chain n=1 Tax=Limanda limanda TaxID=27771 RepID=UPI0029C8749B|nr:fibrinogen alpha chain [Limanda limanda]